MEAAIVTEFEVYRITERLLDLCHDGRRRQRDRDAANITLRILNHLLSVLAFSPMPAVISADRARRFHTL
jgi:hypothetical protein